MQSFTIYCFIKCTLWEPDAKKGHFGFFFIFYPPLCVFYQ